MGVQSLRLGLVDAAGVLRSVRRLKTRELPRLAAPRVPNQEREGDSTAAERDPEQERGTTQESQAWDPADGIDWAFRVLAALRDYCQEAADVQTYTRSATHPHSNPRPDSPSPAHSNLSRTSPPPSSARPSPHASKPRTRDPVWRVEVRPLAGETRVLVRRLDGVRGLVPPAVARAYAVGYEES
ncbi:hypothetical protein B0H10DRAFT_54287 [Mycena sp. CBHHK59/15]|nr:hypothetical protein B0H10DRAFT_54287 [Mycena sp. CBHHK59/15]